MDYNKHMFYYEWFSILLFFLPIFGVLLAEGGVFLMEGGVFLTITGASSCESLPWNSNWKIPEIKQRQLREYILINIQQACDIYN